MGFGSHLPHSEGRLLIIPIKSGIPQLWYSVERFSTAEAYRPPVLGYHT